MIVIKENEIIYHKNLFCFLKYPNKDQQNEYLTYFDMKSNSIEKTTEGKSDCFYLLFKSDIRNGYPTIK